MAHRPLAAALIASLALMGAAPSSSIAQADSAQTQPSPGVNVDFPGGTMEAYVEALRASSASPINVIFRHEAASLPVPRIQLRNVSVGTALEVAIPQRGAWSVMNDDGTTTLYSRNIDIIDAQSPAYPAGFRPMPAYVISASERVREPAQRQVAQPTRIEIFALGESVDGPSQTRDLLHAVDLALDLDQTTQKAEVKLHEDTMLLIARGTDAQIDAVQNVIHRLRDNKINAVMANQNRTRQVNKLRAELIERRADVEELEIRRDMAAQQLAKAQQLLANEYASDQEVQELEGEYRIVLSRLQAAQARLESISEEFADLTREGDSRPESFERAYSTPDAAAHDRVLGILQAIDSISGRIRSVESGKDGSPTSIRVRADEEGHRVVGRIVAAMSRGS